jgi:hypothetical protein
MSKNLIDRQAPLVALVSLGPDDIAGGGATINLPRGTLLASLTAWKQTAFNTGGTTPSITIKAVDSAATLISDEVLTGTGAVTVDTPTKFYPNGDTITVTIAESAASGLVHATAGQVIVQAQYVQLGNGGQIRG